MEIGEIFWRSKYGAEVYCADKNETNGCYSIKTTINSDFTLLYDPCAGDMRWIYSGQKYHLDIWQIGALKYAIATCKNPTMFDFSNTEENLSDLWCYHIRSVNRFIGELLSCNIPWPFVPALIVMLSNEMYENNEFENID